MRSLFSQTNEQAIILLIGATIALGLRLLQGVIGESGVMYVLGIGYLLLAGYFFVKRNGNAGKILTLLGVYLLMSDLINLIARPLARLALSIDNQFWGNATAQLADYIKVLFQTPPPVLMIIYLLAAVVIAGNLAGKQRQIIGTLLLALGGTLAFVGEPLALIGTPYIIIARLCCA